MEETGEVEGKEDYSKKTANLGEMMQKM